MKRRGFFFPLAGEGEKMYDDFRFKQDSIPPLPNRSYSFKAPDALAACVAIASIKAGERQS
jgi:hypothetical protein